MYSSGIACRHSMGQRLFRSGGPWLFRGQREILATEEKVFQGNLKPSEYVRTRVQQ